MPCVVCKDKRYLIVNRLEDRRWAVERCTNCTTHGHEDSAKLALKDGIRCRIQHPCYLGEWDVMRFTKRPHWLTTALGAFVALILGMGVYWLIAGYKISRMRAAEAVRMEAELADLRACQELIKLNIVGIGETEGEEFSQVCADPAKLRAYMIDKHEKTRAAVAGAIQNRVAYRKAYGENIYTQMEDLQFFTKGQAILRRLNEQLKRIHEVPARGESSTGRS